MAWLGTAAAIPIAPPKKKRTLLPLLTVVFLASYGLMTLLIVEQGETIQAQRNLIQVLMGDSRELWSMKEKALAARAGLAQNQTQSTSPKTRSQQSPSVQVPPVQLPSTETPSTQIPSNQIPSNQAPLKQSPSTQVPSNQTPSTQVQRHHSPGQAGKGAIPNTQVPPMPASDLSDQRRVLIVL